MSGLLGLAPVWYHSQNPIPVRSSFAKDFEVLPLSASLTSNHAPSPSHERAPSSEETPDNLAENALKPQGRAAIESFQINAALSRSTPDPDLAQRLGLETAAVPAVR
jgi:hypothetical protein